jgi:Holliday junction resolvase RusA-like endonuclease
MRPPVTIEVRGEPAPQGSKRVFNGNVVEMSKKVGPWREAVRSETQRMISVPFDGAVEAFIWLHLSRPKTLPARIAWPIKRPDWDKLARAVCDGLQMGGAFADDSQITDCLTIKRFAPGPPGCLIVLREKRPDDTAVKSYLVAMLAHDEAAEQPRPEPAPRHPPALAF